MCFKPKTNSTVNQAVPPPNETATPAPIGSPRTAEDQTLFGGTPDLRAGRPTDPTSYSGHGGASPIAGGSGLNLM